MRMNPNPSRVNFEGKSIFLILSRVTHYLINNKYSIQHTYIMNKHEYGNKFANYFSQSSI